MYWFEDQPTEEEIERRREQDRRAEAEADRAFAALPLAGHTQQCPKCLFGMLTYRYQTCNWSFGHWGRGSGVLEYFQICPPTRELIVRTCPQCGADTFERPADSVTDYEQDAA
ncbi:hypothetical protein [Nocardia brasiliensis]|uniref:hypothetical protein n=1 Tax=Nocardia brasiliensis TaxID=37326 RepID=UPI0024579E71|nr:hypothetical protein [Nocardia brasiliensis]